VEEGGGTAFPAGSHVMFTGPYGVSENGTYSECLAVRKENPCLIPDNINDLSAAGAPVAYLTAQMTLSFAGFAKGKTVLAPAIEGRTTLQSQRRDHLGLAGQEGRRISSSRKGRSEWTCLPGPPPGATHDEPGCFDKVVFQWATDGLAGRPQHIERLGVAYMYTGA
jgi:hypothetical protein